MNINIYSFNPLSSQMLEKEQEENRKMKQMLEDKDRRIAELEREVYLLNKVIEVIRKVKTNDGAHKYVPVSIRIYKKFQYSNYNAHLQVYDLRLSLSYLHQSIETINLLIIHSSGSDRY